MDQGNIEIQAMEMCLSTNNTLADRKRVMHFKRTPFYARQSVSFCNTYNAEVLRDFIDMRARFGDRGTKLKLNQCYIICVKSNSYSFPTLV